MKVEINEQELEKIHRVSKIDQNQEDLYAFTVDLLDNEIDEENDRFETYALSVLAKLAVGIFGIVQVPNEIRFARIYDAEVVTDHERKTAAGEAYSYLRVKAYMLRANTNDQIVQSLDSSGRKDFSIDCCVQSIRCSICGNDIKAQGCEHKKGKRYRGELCHYVLGKPFEFSEWEVKA